MAGWRSEVWSVGALQEVPGDQGGAGHGGAHQGAPQVAGSHEEQSFQLWCPHQTSVRTVQSPFRGGSSPVHM